MNNDVDAIIKIKVPKWQIGQEVNIHFKDTMMIKGTVQEPKIGHWKIVEHNNEFAICSECNCYWKWSTIENCNIKFCPNCGTKMKREG